VQRIAKVCNENRIVFILQLAHALGAVTLKLHEWNVDAGVWCSYKYLNAGPGSVGGIFVHSKHASMLPGLCGWFGVAKDSMFNMDKNFKPEEGASKFRLSTFDPFHFVRVQASVELF